MRMRTVATLLTTAVVLGALVVAPMTAEAAYPGANGRIVYRGAGELRTIAGTGGDDQLLIDMNAPVEYPNYTPNGNAVTFDATVSGDNEIYRVPAAGGTAVPLTDNNATDWGAHQGTNGKIVFVRDSSVDNHSDLWIMKANGSQQKRLTKTPNANEWNPKFSPNGQRILFSSDAKGTHDIWIVNSDGSGRNRIWHSGDQEIEPDWAPNGNRIVFVNGSTPNRLVVARPDGSHSSFITTAFNDVRTPNWSPDGDWIAFVDGTGVDIWTVRPNGNDIGMLDNDLGANIGWQST